MLWDYKQIFKIDLRFIYVILILMTVSLFVISSMTGESTDFINETFFTPHVIKQLQRFLIGWIVFFILTCLDYRVFCKWSFFLYVITIILLLGVFFTSSIQSVHRWYKIPMIGINVQPSEYAKLVIVLTLAAFLDKKKDDMKNLSSSLYALLIAVIPFLLILKQPDLGTALVIYPISLALCFFVDMNKNIIRIMYLGAFCAAIFVFLFFSQIVSHEKMQPLFTKFLKPYQYERLNPNTYHQNAAKTAIAIGGFSGSGFRKSEFSSKKWLPAAHTDSVFAAIGEEFGFIGIVILLSIFYYLIYLSFQISSLVKDSFGKLLSSGIAVYLIMHIIVNILMMCGFLPISGVPLLLITYGGSSVFMAMAALGILQSIYTRRFVF